MSEYANKNSMLYWFPKAQYIVNTPKTIFLELEDTNDGYKGCPKKWDKERIEEISNYLGLPMFVRTDQASNKHYMEDSSYIPNLDVVDEHISELLFFNEMAGLMGLPYKQLVFREWLDIEHKFKAFKGTPIGKELRFFIKDNDVQCYHYYWPEKAIKFFGDTKKPDNWKELLKSTREETLLASDEPIMMADEIANQFDGYWSVDFAIDTDGNWYMIDMAKGDESWHPECNKK